jgi:hypothetical protein
MIGTGATVLHAGRYTSVKLSDYNSALGCSFDVDSDTNASNVL